MLILSTGFLAENVSAFVSVVVFFLLTDTAFFVFFFFQAEDGIRDIGVTGVQTCALPISNRWLFIFDMIRSLC